MSMTRKPLLTLLSLLLTLCMTAQNNGSVDKRTAPKGRTVELTGSVDDSFTNIGLRAKVTVMNADSAVVGTVTCYSMDRNSYFHIDIPRQNGRYIIRATHDGYESATVNYEVKVRGSKKYYEVPTIKLKKKRDDIYKSVDLNDVVVRGTRVQIAYRGDTIVYDATAFNMPEGSMLKGLVSQLPGAEIKDNGDIYVKGRKVDYLMLNGKDFFKGDNKMMLDNLPYFTVKDIKVYDRDTERNQSLGQQIDKKEYVMDVGLKREYARGIIANAEAGAGSERRWMGRAFGLYYDDFTRITLFGNANNVNENRGPGESGDWNPSKMPAGLLTTKQVGLNIDHSDRKKTVMENFTSTLKWDDTDNQQRTASENFSSQGNIMRGSSSISRNDNFEFRARNTLALKKLNLRTNVETKYSQGDGQSSSSDSTYQTALINRSSSALLSKRRELDINGYVDWYLRFEGGNYLNLHAAGRYNTRKPNETFDLRSMEYAESGNSELRNNYQDRHSSGYNFDLTALYGTPLPYDWRLSLIATYKQRRESRTNENFRLDSLGGVYADNTGFLPSTRDSMLLTLDRESSYSSVTMGREYAGELLIAKSTRKNMILFSLPYSYVDERLWYLHDGVCTTKNRGYGKFTPRFELGKINGAQTLNFSYRLLVDQPDIVDMMPRTDSSNPLAVRLTNPDLKSNIKHDVSLYFSSRIKKISMDWWANLKGMIVQRATGTRTTYDTQTGAYTYMADNVKGNWNGSFNAGMVGPLPHNKRLRYELRGVLNYQHSVDFDVTYDDDATRLSKVNTLRPEMFAKLSYQNGPLRASLTGSYVSQHSRSHRENFGKLDVYDFNYGANLQYTIPWVKLTIATDLQNYSRRGYDTAYMNSNDLVWNAQLTRPFLKGSVVAKLQAYDILHQLSTRQYSVNAQGRTETWYNSIPRYVIFSLAYKFIRKPNKK